MSDDAEAVLALRSLGAKERLACGPDEPGGSRNITAAEIREGAAALAERRANADPKCECGHPKSRHYAGHSKYPENLNNCTVRHRRAPFPMAYCRCRKFVEIQRKVASR